MLKKFNDLYSKILFEETEEQDWFRKITKDKEFFIKYLNPLIQECNVRIAKARLNTFQVGGLYENVVKFLENFKVDNDFWNDSVLGEFVVYSPMITFCENIHLMDRTEGYTAVEPISNYYQNNFARQVIEGHWYEPKQLENINNFEYPVRAKSTTPKNFIKLIDNLIEELGYTKDIIVIIEFQINCEGYINQCYDEMTSFRPAIDKNKVDIADVMNNPKKMSEPTAKSKLPESKEKNKAKIN